MPPYAKSFSKKGYIPDNVNTSSCPRGRNRRGECKARTHVRDHHVGECATQHPGIWQGRPRAGHVRSLKTLTLARYDILGLAADPRFSSDAPR